MWSGFLQLQSAIDTALLRVSTILMQKVRVCISTHMSTRHWSTITETLLWSFNNVIVEVLRLYEEFPRKILEPKLLLKKVLLFESVPSVVN